MLFYISLYMLSKMLTYVPLIREVLSSVGARTFTIFFTHAAILAMWPWNLNWGSVLVRNRILKMIFIGK